MKSPRKPSHVCQIKSVCPLESSLRGNCKGYRGMWNWSISRDWYVTGTRSIHYPEDFSLVHCISEIYPWGTKFGVARSYCLPLLLWQSMLHTSNGRTLSTRALSWLHLVQIHTGSKTKCTFFSFSRSIFDDHNIFEGQTEDIFLGLETSGKVCPTIHRIQFAQLHLRVRIRASEVTFVPV